MIRLLSIPKICIVDIDQALLYLDPAIHIHSFDSIDSMNRGYCLSRLMSWIHLIALAPFLNCQFPFPVSLVLSMFDLFHWTTPQNSMWHHFEIQDLVIFDPKDHEALCAIAKSPEMKVFNWIEFFVLCHNLLRRMVKINQIKLYDTKKMAIKIKFVEVDKKKSRFNERKSRTRNNLYLPCIAVKYRRICCEVHRTRWLGSRTVRRMLFSANQHRRSNGAAV